MNREELLATMVFRSSADESGGSYATGVSVMPNGRAGTIGGKIAFMNGGPLGSRAIMNLTRFGLESPRTQPKGPDCE